MNSPLVIDCPRCGRIPCFDDGRCVICGQTPDEEGPAPRRILRGVFVEEEDR